MHTDPKDQTNSEMNEFAKQREEAEYEAMQYDEYLAEQALQEEHEAFLADEHHLALPDPTDLEGLDGQYLDDVGDVDPNVL